MNLSSVTVVIQCLDSLIYNDLIVNNLVSSPVNFHGFSFCVIYSMHLFNVWSKYSHFCFMSTEMYHGSETSKIMKTIVWHFLLHKHINLLEYISLNHHCSYHIYLESFARSGQQFLLLTVPY